MGKTSVAIKLAQHFRTAIVSADSRQIFREMSIGTAKPTAAEQAAVPHYLIDSHSVAEDYDAAGYAVDALKIIGDLFVEHDYVILCGGSGLYIKAVCEGFDPMPPVPHAVRAEIMKHYEEEGIGWLQDRMQTLDPEGLDLLDRQNPHRLVRALEVKVHTGKSIFSFRKNEKADHPFDVVKVGLELPREELYSRIDERMDQMIADGLFEEARRLYPLRARQALQTVGYREIFGFMEGAYGLDECVRLLKRNSRRYAKRQLTWFRKDKEFNWFSPDDFTGIVRCVEEL